MLVFDQPNIPKPKCIQITVVEVYTRYVSTQIPYGTMVSEVLSLILLTFLPYVLFFWIFVFLCDTIVELLPFLPVFRCET